ncbi:hypothetical protein TOPH_07146 [Tolypocladium ophioglossoides CBS 100239]|uniref:Uncharacterized protein n=1 Tax=Tolypocladium ophioglossoides (strain CBS 100239) TaxID=1163406 RepID=A0A0L0N1W3_TOLOC|nr:hypothetical protein TOPH_07146 [Tolypocladium ophioglossoides CBS 100239]
MVLQFNGVWFHSCTDRLNASLGMYCPVSSPVNPSRTPPTSSLVWPRMNQPSPVCLQPPVSSCPTASPGTDLSQRASWSAPRPASTERRWIPAQSPPAQRAWRRLPSRAPVRCPGSSGPPGPPPPPPPAPAPACPRETPASAAGSARTGRPSAAPTPPSGPRCARPPAAAARGPRWSSRGSQTHSCAGPRAPPPSVPRRRRARPCRASCRRGPPRTPCCAGPSGSRARRRSRRGACGSSIPACCGTRPRAASPR